MELTHRVSQDRLGGGGTGSPVAPGPESGGTASLAGPSPGAAEAAVRVTGGPCVHPTVPLGVSLQHLKPAGLHGLSLKLN